MIRIAVSQRIDSLPERAERRDSLDQRLISFLARLDLMPLPLPNGLKECGLLSAWLSDLRPEGLVLSGGNDIGVESDRDDTEKIALEWAIYGRLPVLGICRGMQFLGVHAGGKLTRVEGHVRTRHALRGEISGSANSFHDFALSDMPSGYRMLACAEDGHVEAMRHCQLPIEGWMWHPEREADFDARDITRARALFHAHIRI